MSTQSRPPGGKYALSQTTRTSIVEAMITKPTKAIIAVAGYGTRRLPVAKAIEKCMIPLLNRPVVDYMVEDLVNAGVTDIYFVVSGDARQLRDYYSRDVELEQYLARKDKDQLIPAVTPPQQVTFHYIEQDLGDPRYGTSIPTWLCRDYVRPDETFYLIMGDQTLWRADGRSECQLLFDDVAASGAEGGLIGVPVPYEQVELYGVIVKDDQQLYQSIVEKPKRDEAPSNLNNASVYLLPGSFMPYVDRQAQQQREGEYYLTDVLNDFVADHHPIFVRSTDAAFLDCGNVEGWVAANSFLLGQTTH